MIYHVYSDYMPVDAETRRRQIVARVTWSRLTWRDKGMTDSALPRVFRDGRRTVPYVVDVFDFGCSGTDDEDIIVYTNADIMVRRDACGVLADALQKVDACYAYRRDFHHQILTPLPDADYCKGLDYAGSDLVAFRAGWWRFWRKEMPDMLIATEAWDPVIRQLIDETNPQGGTVVRDIICHERHGTDWENPKYRYKLTSQLHNHGLARMFFGLRGINFRKFGIP